jgi:hypothetical protein
MDFLGQEKGPFLARFDRYRLKRQARMGNVLFVELVKAVACRNGEKALRANEVDRPVRISPIVEWRVIRRACHRHFLTSDCV